MTINRPMRCGGAISILAPESRIARADRAHSMALARSGEERAYRDGEPAGEFGLDSRARLMDAADNWPGSSAQLPTC